MTDAGHNMTRRGLIRVGAGGAVALAAGGAWIGCGGEPTPPRVRPLPASRPDRQFAWDAVLTADDFGNRRAPRHHRLVHLEVQGRPTVAAAAALEDALRALEERTPAGPDGLLLVVGWGPAWFEAIDAPSPVDAPEALTPEEAPDLDRFAACLHIASNRRDVLVDAERTIRRAVRDPLQIAPTRIGFTAPGMPRRLSGRVEGIPAGQPDRDAPLFMGFTSGFRRNQAREDDVMITEGDWAGGTTMHVSALALALSTWYGSLSTEQRAKRMFAPQVTLDQVRHPGAGLDVPGNVRATARRHGLVGHAQSMVDVRRENRPRILRRDFNGLDGRYPLVHFVALQRSIADFVETRRAMAASKAVAADERVTPHVNNGINEWISTRSRANYLVPPRSRRTCPGLAGWDA